MWGTSYSHVDIRSVPMETASVFIMEPPTRQFVWRVAVFAGCSTGWTNMEKTSSLDSADRACWLGDHQAENKKMRGCWCTVHEVQPCPQQLLQKLTAMANTRTIECWYNPEGGHNIMVLIGAAQPPMGKYAFCRTKRQPLFIDPCIVN